jgi:uncharacterized membrane protein YfcA
VAAAAGALAACRLGARLSTDKLQRWFAYLVFVVAAFVTTNPGAHRPAPRSVRN